jgi:diacylglycerol O-acyltransferase / wax synthase
MSDVPKDDHELPHGLAGPAIQLREVMHAADAVLWDIEHDPVLRSTITAIGLFDKAPDWERLVARLEQAVVLVPRLGQRVVTTPFGLGPPLWVTDPDFDLSYHLRRVQAPEPRDLSAVLAIAQPIAMAAFDRERPLWEFTVVEGLADGRAALIQKVHHSLTDGVGGVQLALALLDDRPDVPLDPPVPLPHGRPPQLPGTVELLLRAAVEQVSGAIRVAGSLGHTMVRVVPQLGELVPSTWRLLKPIAAPASAVLHGRSLTRRLGVLEVPLEDLRRAGKAADGSINDAFLAAVVGGLTRYHAHHAVNLEQIRITMPINSRDDADEIMGNRFAPARFAAPGDIEDPIERMKVLGSLARAWQREPAIEFTDGLAAALGLLPVPLTAAVFRGMLGNVDLVCSNVPGIPQRSWIAGAELIREYPFAPASGSALSVTMMSHGDTACIGVTCDVAAVDDPALLCECLHEALGEVIAVGYRA